MMLLWRQLRRAFHLVFNSTPGLITIIIFLVLYITNDNHQRRLPDNKVQRLHGNKNMLQEKHVTDLPVLRRITNSATVKPTFPYEEPERGNQAASQSRRNLEDFGDKTGSKWTKSILEYRERKSRIDTACNAKTRPSEYLSKFARTHIHVDDAHRAMYCLIPKVSSTNWLRMLVNLSSQGENTRAVNGRGIDLHGTKLRMKHGIVPLNNYTGEEFLGRLNNYTKIIITRDPFHRWLSGFRQKFASPHYKRFAQSLIKTYRKGATVDEIQEGKLKFGEFMEHLVRKGKYPLTMDQHWAPYDALCDPCYVHYDLVVKLETLSDDLAFLKDYVFNGAPQAVMPQSDQVQTKNQIVRDFYSQIPEALIHDITDMFLDDFAMFSYSRESPARL